MPTLNPYLTFNGNCRDAMNFYKEVLGGELTMMTAGESPMADKMPPHLKDQILHSQLKTDELTIMATDMQAHKMVPGNDNHMCLVFKDEQQTRDMYAKLSAGGTAEQPLSKMFFGWIGTLIDPFGKHWILECDQH